MFHLMFIKFILILFLASITARCRRLVAEDAMVGLTMSLSVPVSSSTSSWIEFPPSACPASHSAIKSSFRISRFSSGILSTQSTSNNNKEINSQLFLLRKTLAKK